MYVAASRDITHIFSYRFAFRLCLSDQQVPPVSPHHGGSVYHPLGSGMCGLKLALSFACSEVWASLVVFLGLYSFSDMLE